MNCPVQYTSWKIYILPIPILYSEEFWVQGADFRNRLVNLEIIKECLHSAGCVSHSQPCFNLRVGAANGMATAARRLGRATAATKLSATCGRFALCPADPAGRVDEPSLTPSLPQQCPKLLQTRGQTHHSTLVAGGRAARSRTCTTHTGV